MSLTPIVLNKIGLLWCHIHIELRLIEVEVNLSGISLTSIRSKFDTFCMANNFHFLRLFVFTSLFFCFLG